MNNKTHCIVLLAIFLMAVSSFKVTAQAPTAPANVTAAVVSDTKISLSWGDTGNETHFIVMRATTAGGPYTEVERPGANVLAYGDTDLSPNTTYYYKVAAANASGTANSAEVFAQTLTAKAKTEHRLGDGMLNTNHFHFGIGLSVTVDLGSHDRIKRASVEEIGTTRYLRVDEDRDIVPRFVLETHYFFEPNWKFLWATTNWGHGPYISVEPGGNNIINAVGGGWMLGFQRERLPGQLKPDSFNIGIGYMVDPSVQILGSNQHPDKELEDGEQIRYKTTAQGGLMIVFSVAW